MSKSLVIVESPAKAKTIEKYLGKGFEVRASIGHIMDLPKNDIGVELKNRTFVPELVVSPGKEKIVDQLKKAGLKADEIFLAPDPDREGEAIACHLAMQLGTSAKERSKIRRVTFNEITKKAVQEAFKHARDIDENLVDAQQTRRVLDRLVGYQISPLLWDKVRRGLSAGRVQTVAVRLIVEREREMAGFKPVEYWTLEALLHPERQADKSFKAKFVGIDGEAARVAERHRQSRQGAVHLPARCPIRSRWMPLWPRLKRRRGRLHRWNSASSSAARWLLSLPANCSAMQPASWGSMFAARWAWRSGSMKAWTSATRVRPASSLTCVPILRASLLTLLKARVHGSASNWAAKYLPESPNVYKGKKDAQDAHEAIRPTDASRTPESIARYLSDEQLKLYTLIWKRFIASQMVPAVYDITTAKIEAKSSVDRKTYEFRLSGSVLRFDGFLKVYRLRKRRRPTTTRSLGNKLPNLDGVKKP